MEKVTFAQSGVNGEPSPRMEPAASDGSDEYKEHILYSRQPQPKSTFWGTRRSKLRQNHLLAQNFGLAKEVMEKVSFVESGVNRDLRASLASEASQALQRHQNFWGYSRLHKSWSRHVFGHPWKMHSWEMHGRGWLVGHCTGKAPPPSSGPIRQA